jgi:hypothetical protein
MIVIMTTEWMIPSGTNSLPAEVLTRITIIGLIPLLIDYWSPRVSSLSNQCYYHWVNTSAGRLLVPEVIIRSVVSVTITGSILLLVDYSNTDY